MRSLGRWLLGAMLLYGVAAGVIVGIGLHDHDAPADLIIVPGNTVHADGSVSPRLQARLDAAVVLFRAGLAPAILVSGGTGSEGRDEAAAMAAYLVAQGIPRAAVVQDPLGVDTAATAANAASYLRARGLRSALVATQHFHVARMSLALRRSGVQVVGSRHARYAEARDLYSLAREVVGYAVYQATGRPANAPTAKG